MNPRIELTHEISPAPAGVDQLIYLKLSKKPVDATKVDVYPGVNVDLAEDRSIVGIEVTLHTPAEDAE